MSRKRRFQGKVRQPRGFQPRLETLELRLTPATVHWNVDSNGFFDVASNWDTGKVPGAGDDVVINRANNNVTVTVRDHETINTLQNSDSISVISGGGLRIESPGSIGGSLSLDGDYLEVDSSTTESGVLTWKSGTIFTSGQGLTNAGTITLANSTDVTLSGVLINNATVSLAGSANLVLNNTLTNSTSGQIDLTTDVGITGNAVFNNSGTIRKSTGNGVSRIGPADGALIYFNQLGGTLDAKAGTLQIDQTRTSVLETGGTWNASAGATLDFEGNQSSGTYFAGAFTGSGSGVVQLNSGSFGIDSGGATFNFPASLLQWTGGTFFGNPVTNAGSITLAGAADKTSGSLFNNNGTIVLAGTGNLVVVNTFNNNASGLIDLQSDAGINGNAELNNRGTIRKSGGAGIARIGPAANSNLYFNQLGGTLHAQSGILQFDQTRTDLAETGGTWNASAGATLDFEGNQPSGTYFAGTFTGSGAGVVQLNSGFFGIDSAGATFNFPAGLLQWTGGTFFGNPLTNAGSITLPGVADKTSSIVFNNNGTLEVTGTGNLVLGNTFNNNSTGVIDLQSDAGINGNALLNNSGTIRKSAGAGTSRVGPAANSILYFNQLGGTLAAQSGTLQLDQTRTNLTETGGTWNATAGATLDFEGNADSGTYFAGTFTGSGGGVVLLNSGAFGIDSSGATFNFPAGLLQWAGGNFFANAFSNTGSITLTGSGDKILSNRMDNSGVLVETGTGNLVVNGKLNNLVTGLIDIQSDGGMTGNGTIINAGTFQKSAGAGSSVVSSIFFTVNGLEAALSGRLNLAGSGFWSGSVLNAAAGAVLEVSGGPAVTGLFTGAGAGRVEFSGGFAPVDGGVNGATVTFNFPANFMHWTGGEIGGGGSASVVGTNIAITNAGSMIIDGPNAKSIRRNTLINIGTIIDAGPGDVILNGVGDFATSVIDNRAGGLFEFRGDVNIIQTSGNIGVFINSGLVEKSAGTGIAILGENFNSSATGVVEVHSGRLQLAGGGNSTGGNYFVDQDAVLEFTLSRDFDMTGTYTGGGQGLIDFKGDMVGVDDANPARLDFAAGFLQFDGAGWLGTIENDGFATIVGNVDLFARAHIINIGTMIDQSTANLSLNANTFFENRGLFDFQADASMIVPADASGGNMRFTNTGLLRKSGGTGISQLAHAGDGKAFLLNNTGTVEVNSGTLAILDPIVQVTGTTLTAGTWIVGASGTLSFPAGTNISNNQAEVILNGAMATFGAIQGLTANAGVLSLNQGASFATVGNFANSGTLQIGAGSQLMVNGSFTQATGSKLQVEIGGPAASNQFGQLKATGQASLGGALVIDLAPGFGPTQGDVYSVVTYASKQGAFGALAGLPPFFSASVGASIVTVTGTASAANLAVDSITLPANATPGQNITVTFTIENTTTIPITGSWTDSVYLSHDTVFGPDDVLLGRVSHAGGVAAMDSYTGSLNAVLPNLIDGAYHLLVVADSSIQVADANRADNTLASSTTLSVHASTLTLGSPTTNNIVAGTTRLYRLDVPAGSGDLIISTTTTVASEADIFVSYATFPTADNAIASSVNATGLQNQLLISNPQAGAYYVLVVGRTGAATPQNFTLSPRLAGFEIRTVTPNQASNAGRATVTITGSGFTTASKVSLVSGGVSRQATSVLMQDSTTLFATFDLTGLATGAFDVKVVDGARTANDAGAFHVTSGAVGKLKYELDTTSVIRVGAVSTVTIRYTNTGGTDIPAPLLTLSSDNASFRLTSQDSWQAGGIQLLAFNPGGPAGTLTPGASNSITVQFLPITQAIHVDSNFTLSAVVDPTQKIDWNSLKDGLKPVGVSTDAWNAVYANFVSLVGGTIGSYQNAMDAAATYLSGLGQYTPDLSRLQQLELQIADEFGSLSSRNTLGQFGWGVFGPNDSQVQSAPTGNVIVTVGTQQRMFIPDAKGAVTFHGSSGDPATATLNTSVGTFVIRESDSTQTTYGVNLSAGQIQAGRLLRTQDPNGNIVTYTASGYSDAQGNSVTYTPIQGGLVVKDSVGRSITYLFDTSKNLASVTDRTGTTTFSYMPGNVPATAHALQSIAFPDGVHEFFQYDNFGRLSKTNFDNNSTPVTYSYGATGQVTITDALGNQIVLSADDSGVLSRVQDPRAQILSGKLDGSGNPVQISDETGGKVTASYDSLGNLTKSVDALGNTIQYTFDPTTDTLTSMTDARGIKTTYGRDSHGNLKTVAYPDGTTEQYQYDAIGNVTQSTNRLGKSTFYTYGSGSLVTRVQYSDGSIVIYTYDAHRNLATATDNTGVTSFTYDAADHLTRIVYPDGKFIAYTYNSFGLRTQMQAQDGYTLNYVYDALGRLAGLKDANGAAIVSYSYDAVGRVSRVDNANGTSTAYQYDGAGDTTSVVNTAANSSVLSSFSYSYSLSGLVQSMTTLEGTTNYGYDGNGQLVSVQLPGGRTLVYQYDASGNRISVKDSGITTTYTTNLLNEYTSAGTATYGYDAAGRVISRTDSSGTTTYAYDAAGRLIESLSPTDSWSYEYDVLGNMSATTHNGVRTENLIDPTGSGDLIAQYVGGTVAASYAYGLGLASQTTNSGAAYYSFDASGNTADLTGASGAVLDSYSYLPFGQVLKSSGSVDNPFTFVGQFGVSADGNGLYYMRNRWYDPQTGRFTKPDVLGLDGGDVNLYRYTSNNPVNEIDPSGTIGEQLAINLVATFRAGLFNGLDPNTAPLLKEAFDVVRASDSATAAAIARGRALPLIEHVKDLYNNLPAPKVSAGAGKALAEDTVGKVVAEDTAGVVGDAVGSGILGTAAKGLGLAGAVYSGYQLGTGIHDKVGFTNVGDVVVAHIEANKHKQDIWNPGTQDSQAYNDAVQRAENRQAKARATTHAPGDPNDLSGPGGFGPSNFVSGEQTFPYMVEFENILTADAPAQVVKVTQQLDSHLDWSTFQLGNFGFGGQTFAIPAGLTSYSVRLDESATLGVWVDILAQFDVATGQLSFTYTSIDPATGDLPVDVLTGFLPPNTANSIGTGFLTYSVLPKFGLPTGTAILAKATVIFDAGLSDESHLDTPQFTNTIDAGAPSSTISVPKFVASKFTVNWSATDDASGSGIASYDVYVSDNGGVLTPFLIGTTQTSALFTGLLNHTFSFFVVATDNVGNVEATPAAAQAVAQAILDTPSKQYVSAVYLDLLKRSVDLGGLTFWSGQLDQGAARSVIAAQLTHSAEYFKTNVIVPAYRQFLNRNADQGGIDFWTQQLQHGLTDEQMQGGFIASPEFFNNAGGTNKAWIDALYEALLDRHADSAGEEYWLNQLKGHESRLEVANDFTGSPEGLGDRVQQTYQRYLGRKAGPSEVDFWVGQYHQGKTNEDIVTGFLASDEYFNKHTG